MQPDRWQQQYRDVADELERRAQGWDAAEKLLRRIAGRLCIAARGQHPALDGALDAVIETLRRPAASATLEPLLDALTRAVAELDPAPGAAGAAGATGPARALATAAQASAPVPETFVAGLRRLLDRLVEEADAAPRARVLAERLDAAGDAAAFAAVALQVADLADAQAARSRRARAAADRLLQQFNERLADIVGHLRRDDEQRDEAQADGRAFGRDLLDQTEALALQAREASDLATLQDQLQRRLTAIDQRVRDHRGREEARIAIWRERNDALHERVEELEARMGALRQTLRRAQRRASTDGLTGLANRSAYDERVAADLAAFRHDQRPRSLAAFDIDHFKTLNDTYGHVAGDKVLQVIARQFAGRLRDRDFFARYGGEEFVLLFDDIGVSRALELAQQLREAIGALGFHFRGLPVSVTVSCGLTAFRDADSPQTVFERADRALYEAKRSGRNRCCVAA